MYFHFDPTLILMLPALVISMYAQYKVNATFNKYLRINASCGMTGLRAAQQVLTDGGAAGVSFRQINGSALQNFFDPTNNSISLSNEVYNTTSISAIGVAAHEAGHAVQHAHGYMPNKIRSGLFPITKFGSSLSMPLIMIGLFLPVQFDFVVTIGIALFSFSVLFQLVTLPVEFNASSRAIHALSDAGILTQEELAGAKKVLSAAAMTYLAAAFTALVSLFRLLLIANRNAER